MTLTETNFSKQDGVDIRDLFLAQIDNLRILINANDNNYNQRFENVTTATNAALAASDRAVSKAELASEKRFDAVNEFRATLADQQRSLMPRAELEVMIKAINEKIDALNLSTIARQSEGLGQKEGIGQMAIVASIVSAVVGLLFKFMK